MTIDRLIILLIILSFHRTFHVINRTHFSCDGEKVHPRNRINDNHCDCLDGTDETKTNACENGIFTCINRFHRPINISTSKVNDGNCDCCDGSDEFSKKTCQKTCIDLSKKEYDQFLEQFNNIESNLKEIDNSYIEMFQEHNKKIDIIIKNYHELEELNEKHFLILSYLNKLRNNIGEDVFDRNIDYQDINGFIIRDLKDSLNNIGEQIYQKEQFLEENYNLINNLSLMITFLGKEKECISTNYKGGSLSACLMGGVEFSGYKGRYWNRRSLGQFSKIENNTIYFEKGDKCGFYNKERTAKIKLECSKEESLVFWKKNRGCEYEMKYKTKYGCNYFNLLELQKTILLYLKEI